jgi:hypothetical protein
MLPQSEKIKKTLKVVLNAVKRMSPENYVAHLSFSARRYCSAVERLELRVSNVCDYALSVDVDLKNTGMFLV